MGKASFQMFHILFEFLFHSNRRAFVLAIIHFRVVDFEAQHFHDLLVTG